MEKYIPALKYHFLTPIYDTFIKLTMPEKNFKNELIRQMNIQAGEQILDYGAGTITLTLLAERQHPEAHFSALDIDQKMLEIAQNKIQINSSKIQLNAYSGGNLPYNDAIFDKVMSSLVFSHLTTEQKIKAFSEIKRVLKPKGELHIADWGKAQNWLMRCLFFVLQVFDNFYTTNNNVRGKMPELLSKAGFSEVIIMKSYATVFGTLQIFKAFSGD